MKNMEILISQALLASLSEVMENMAFEEVELIEDEKELEPVKLTSKKIVWTTLPLLEPLKGDIRLILSWENAAAITELTYGFPERTLTEEVVLDAIAELINTIAGRFLQKFIDADQGFDLGLPQTGIGRNLFSKLKDHRNSFKVGDILLTLRVSEEFVSNLKER